MQFSSHLFNFPMWFEIPLTVIEIAAHKYFVVYTRCLFYKNTHLRAISMSCAKSCEHVKKEEWKIPLPFVWEIFGSDCSEFVVTTSWKKWIARRVLCLALTSVASCLALGVACWFSCQLKHYFGHFWHSPQFIVRWNTLRTLILGSLAMFLTMIGTIICCLDMRGNWSMRESEVRRLILVQGLHYTFLINIWLMLL